MKQIKYFLNKHFTKQTTEEIQRESDERYNESQTRSQYSRLKFEISILQHTQVQNTQMKHSSLKTFWELKGLYVYVTDMKKIE